MNDVPDLEHDECDSLTIDFEEKRACWCGRTKQGVGTVMML